MSPEYIYLASLCFFRVDALGGKQEEYNFGGLLLGCIEADFCNEIHVGNLLARSTRFTCVLWEKRTDIENVIMKMYTGFTYICTAHTLKFQKKYRKIKKSQISSISKFLGVPPGSHLDAPWTKSEAGAR